MSEENRPVTDIIAEIKSYNGRKITSERIEDLQILSKELGEDYTVRWWTFNKHLRTAVIADNGYQV